VIIVALAASAYAIRRGSIARAAVLRRRGRGPVPAVEPSRSRSSASAPTWRRCRSCQAVLPERARDRGRRHVGGGGAGRDRGASPRVRAALAGAGAAIGVAVATTRVFLGAPGRPTRSAVCARLDVVRVCAAPRRACAPTRRRREGSGRPRAQDTGSRPQRLRGSRLPDPRQASTGWDARSDGADLEFPVGAGRSARVADEADARSTGSRPKSSGSVSSR
jgi:hypothetical protein